ASILEVLWAQGFTVDFGPGEKLLVSPASTLHDSQRSLIRANKPEIVAYLKACRAAPAPVPDWRALAGAYDAHHFNCRTCIAAGRGCGRRCQVGLALWSKYLEGAEQCHPR